MPNPALNRLPKEQLPARLRAASERSIALRGDATFFEVFGNNPALFDWYLDRFYGELFAGGSVDRRSKELLRLRLSSVHGCRFCNQGNRLDATAAGFSDDQLRAIADGDEASLSGRDAAVLTLANQMLLTNQSGSISEKTHRQLAEHFDDGQILELGVVAAVLTGMAKMMFVFDLVEKEDYCPFHIEGNETG